MNDKQLARLTRNKNIISFWESKAALTATIPAFTAVLAAYKIIVTAIGIKGQKQLLNNSELVAIKNQAKAEFIKNYVVVGAGAFLYAESVNDGELIAISSKSASDLEYLREEQLLLAGDAFKNKLASLPTQLIPFGITDLKVTRFNDSLATLIDAVDKVSGGEAGKKAATATLPQLLTEADTYLVKFNKFADIIIQLQNQDYHHQSNA